MEGVVELGGAVGLVRSSLAKPPRIRRSAAAARAKSSAPRLGSASAAIWPSIRQRARARSSSFSRVITRHAHRAVGQRFQRLLGDQAAQRLADRHGAGLQRAGQILDAQRSRRRRACRGSASGAARHRRGHAAFRGRQGKGRVRRLMRASLRGRADCRAARSAIRTWRTPVDASVDRPTSNFVVAIDAAM